MANNKNWWQRNWKWVSFLSATVFALSVYGFYLSFMLNMMKTSEPYISAVATARASPMVIEKLGSPIAEGYFVSGNMNFSPSFETVTTVVMNEKVDSKTTTIIPASFLANMEIPLSGSKASGTLHVVAKKSGDSGDKWTMSTLTLKLSNGSNDINLLEKM